MKELSVWGKNGNGSHEPRWVWLVVANEAYASVEVLERHELLIWDAVTHVVHACR